MLLRLRIFAAQKLGVNYEDVTIALGNREVIASATDGSVFVWGSLEALMTEFDEYAKRDGRVNSTWNCK